MAPLWPPPLKVRAFNGLCPYASSRVTGITVMQNLLLIPWQWLQPFPVFIMLTYERMATGQAELASVAWWNIKTVKVHPNLQMVSHLSINPFWH